MSSDNTFSRDIRKTADNPEEDYAVKRLFANKPFLSWILKECTDEFHRYSYEEILESLSDDRIDIRKEVVDQDVGRITGDNAEDLSKDEGLVKYDIKFSPVTPDKKESIGIIVNIEGQTRGTGLTYELPSRMVYYGSRLISSKKGTVFFHDHYEKIKKVYSIWIVTNPAVANRNTMAEYRLVQNNICGRPVYKKGSYDLFTGIILNLNRKMASGENSIMKLCNSLMSKATVDEKEQYLHERFGINFTSEIRKEVIGMSGIAEAYFDDGVEYGMDRGINKGLVLGVIITMRSSKASEEQIASTITKNYHLTPDEVENYLRESKKYSLTT